MTTEDLREKLIKEEYKEDLIIKDPAGHSLN